MEKSIPAAQYIRMSTEHQRYSIRNQEKAIQKYADENGYEVVSKYLDSGKSGLSLRGRTGLKQLLADTLGGHARFKSILVVDVSRWGRFQDPDQGAHYEFLCRQAGVAVQYCLEPFDNDGTPLSSLVKGIKRVMASEYSRELGVKVKSGHMNSASLGHKQGGGAPYALRRAILGPDGKPFMILEYGERCPIAGKGIVLVPGPPEEIETVRQIFYLFIKCGRRQTAIAKIVNSEGKRDVTGKPFTPDRIRHILTLELYTGVYSYNKSTSRLQTPRTFTPREAWVRRRMFKPIISNQIFAAAQTRFKKYDRRPWTDDELIDHLKALLKKHGKLSQNIILAASPPSHRLYYARFKTLPDAYELAGYHGYDREKYRLRRRPVYTKEEMLAGLKRAYEREGHLSRIVIRDDPSLPSPTLYYWRFGSLKAAYDAVGFRLNQLELTLAGHRRRSAALKEIAAERQRRRSAAYYEGAVQPPLDSAPSAT